MTKTSIFRKSSTAAAALCVLLALSPATAGRKINRGVEPAHQPIVERTDFVFDVVGDGAGALSTSEQSRLSTWFSALRLGYGDHVSLVMPGNDGLALRDAVGNVVARYGLLVEGDAPVTAGEAPVGGVRIVVSRSIATVPGCPTWRDKGNADFAGGLSDNYGCAVSSNIAAMIADPQDLVEGREGKPDRNSTVSGKAIKTYNDKAPTGAGGLQSMGVGG